MKAAGVKFCKGAIKIQEHASLKPYALVTSLLRILVKKHLLQLHTNTPVTSITSPSGKVKYYEIHTPRGTVKARHVVNATNAWIGHLYPEFQGKIIPTRGQVIHVDAQNLTLDPMGWDDGREYLIQRPDSSIIFGGGRRFSSNPHGKIPADDRKCRNRKCRRHHLRSENIAIPPYIPPISIPLRQNGRNRTPCRIDL
jgi:glycine/D-amino acid oxidase-like deaminating enzyme